MALKFPKKPAAGDPLAAIVSRIKARNSGYAVETGKDLIEAKALVPHGKWGQWLKENFNWSERSAQNYMNATKAVAKNAEFADLKPASIVALTAKNVPEAVKSEVIADLQAGKKPSLKEVKAKITAAQSKAEPKAAPKLSVVPQSVKEPVPDHVPEVKPTLSMTVAQTADALKALGYREAKKAFNEAFPAAIIAKDEDDLLVKATA